MSPSETGAHYDLIAQWWQETTPITYGLTQLHRAISFTSQRGPALDVGCGSQGRFIEVLLEHGFLAEGIDVSAEMAVLAQKRSPQATFYTGDICQWQPPKKYDFISAWDSTFHLPIDQQEPVLQKLCSALAPGGVLIFTCGGDLPGEIAGSFQGQDFGYSTLGVEEFVRLLHQFGCLCRHLEYDQYPEKHVYIIGQKQSLSSDSNSASSCG